MSADPARLVLGIETSCDDTSVAILERGTTLKSHLIAAQDLHRLYGGVVPELAARAHVELLPRMVARALEEASMSARELTAIAVTHGPGLVGSLVVGVAYGKGLAMALDLPVVGVNHIEAHLHAATLEHGESPWPAVALVVSGGHTELVEMRGFGDYRWLGSTRDDAAGEAFDKVAKRLGLGFPGGPAIEALAREGDPSSHDLPRPMLDRPGWDFSFSGLKTAVALAADRLGDPAWRGPRGFVPGRGGRGAGGEDRARGRGLRRGERDRRRGSGVQPCAPRSDAGSAAAARRRLAVPRSLHRQRRNDRAHRSPPRGRGRRPRRVRRLRQPSAPLTTAPPGDTFPHRGCRRFDTFPVVDGALHRSGRSRLAGCIRPR